jgi:serine/threonine protein kinase
VYRGEHILLHHPVAIKVFRPAVGTAALESLDRFRLEGISACRINHPNAVTVLDFDVSAGSLAYLVMELLEGHSLSDELRAGAKLAPLRCTRIAAAVCDVLAQAHMAGIVHRDIKPSNVFLHRTRGDELVKVIDFGIAKLTDDIVDGDQRSTITGMLVGSPAYMAPERLYGDPYDGRADVYAVGVMMYEALTGRLPYATRQKGYWSPAMMHTKNVDAPSTLEPTIPPFVDAAIMRAMAREPRDRPTAAQLAADLRDCVAKLS